MTEAEAHKTIERIGVLFPDWQAWTGKLQNQATLVGWISALMTVDAKHVQSVLADWQFGRRKCPETYERDRLVYLAVEAARQMRSTEFASESSKVAIQTYKQEAALAEQRRKSYRPMDRRLGWCVVEFNRVAEQIISRTGRPRSQWTTEDRDEYDRESKAIIEQYENPSATEPTTANRF